MRIHVIVLSAVGLALITTVCGAATNAPALVETRVVKPAPAFVLQDVDGNAVSSTNFAGKAWIVLFWASWDAPSQKQVAILSELQREYAPAGFTVLGMCLDTRWPDSAKAYATTNSVPFPVLQPDYQVVKDCGGLDAIPTLIIVEPHGHMINRYVGLTERRVLEPDLKSILNLPQK